MPKTVIMSYDTHTKITQVKGPIKWPKLISGHYNKNISNKLMDVSTKNVVSIDKKLIVSSFVLLRT